MTWWEKIKDFFSGGIAEPHPIGCTCRDCLPIRIAVLAIDKAYSSNNTLGWQCGLPYKDGNIFTIAGRYKRRTFLQWFNDVPRELQKFRCRGNASIEPGGITMYEETQ